MIDKLFQISSVITMIKTVKLLPMTKTPLVTNATINEVLI